MLNPTSAVSVISEQTEEDIPSQATNPRQFSAENPASRSSLNHQTNNRQEPKPAVSSLIYVYPCQRGFDSLYCLVLTASSSILKKFSPQSSEYRLLQRDPSVTIQSLVHDARSWHNLTFLGAAVGKLAFEGGRMFQEAVASAGRDEESVGSKGNNGNVTKQIGAALELVATGMGMLLKITCKEFLYVLDQALASEDASLDANEICKLFHSLEVEDYEPFYIDSDTLSFLQVFVSQKHPSLIKGEGRSKEGFSLFGIFSSQLCFAKSRDILKNMMQNPTCEIPVLLDRYQRVQNFSQGLNTNARDQLDRALRETNPLVSIMQKIISKNLALEDWTRLSKYLKSLQLALNLSAAVPGVIGCRYSLAKPAASMVDYLVSLLDALVDPKAKEDIYLIKRGVSINLDDVRTLYENFGQLTENYEREQTLSLQQPTDAPREDSLRLCAIIFLPEIGYLAVCEVAAESTMVNLMASKSHYHQTEGVNNQSGYASNQQTNLQNLPQASRKSGNFASDAFNLEILLEFLSSQQLPADFEFLFERQTKLFFKTSLTREMDEKFGNVRQEIIVLQDRMLSEVIQVLEVYSPLITTALKLCIDVDIHLALAKIAIHESLMIPRFTAENKLLVLGGEHLLTRTLLLQAAGQNYTGGNFFSGELTQQQQAALEAFCGEDNPSGHLIAPGLCSNRIVYLFGPNGSGKSNYLRMIGLAIYSAHVGLPVACKQLVIGPFRKLLAFQQHEDSVAYSESSGLTNLKRFFSETIQKIDCRTIVLTDEFTRGVESSTSQVLTKSLGDYIQAKFGEEFKGLCMICSHDVELVNSGRIKQTDIVRVLKMNYLLRPSDDIEYLFRAVPAESARSMSYYLAKKIITSKDYLESVKFYLEDPYSPEQAFDDQGQLSDLGRIVNAKFKQEFIENLKSSFPHLFVEFQE